MIGPGSINGWRCDRCTRHTYAVHVDAGVTPIFLACRAEGVDPRLAECKGQAVSLMYPESPPPAHVVEAVAWEWYMPDATEAWYLDDDTREHVDKGGLLLRPLTDAGRAALPEVA